MKIAFAGFTLFIAALVAASFGMQDPIILSSGSDSLDRSFTPTLASQLSALMLCFSVTAILMLSPLKKRLHISLKALLLLLTTYLVFISGFSFTISGKNHALVVKWYLISIQSTPFDPTSNLENFSYNTNSLMLNVKNAEGVTQRVLSGPFIWGLNLDAIGNKLDELGITEN